MESLSRDEVADVLETIVPDLERVEAILLEASTAGTPFLTESASYLTKAGGKRLGSLYRVDVTAGEPPLGEPKIRGMLRNPFERRVAVFVTQDMANSAGIQVPVVRVLGGRLDKGFVQNP